MNKILVKTIIFASLILEVFLADLFFLTNNFVEDNRYVEVSSEHFVEPIQQFRLTEVMQDLIDWEYDFSSEEIVFTEKPNLLELDDLNLSILQLSATLHINLPPPYLA